MERDSQVGHDRLVRQPFERRQQPHGRQRDPPRRQREAVLVSHDSQRFHRLVVVVQRFAHAHQHDVESPASHCGSVDEHAHLADDFSGGEIARQPHLAGQAEGACHGAADLRGDAEGHRRRIRDEHRFDVPSVREAKQEFLSAIRRLLALDELGRRDPEVAGKHLAQVERQVAHRRDIGDAAPVNPPENLPRAVRLDAPRRKRRFERRTVELSHVVLHGLGRHGI